MDIQEHDTQVREALSRIDRDLRSLRYTFGTVLIILTVLLAIAAPTLVTLAWNSLMEPAEDTSVIANDTPPLVEEAPVPAAVATTTAATTTAATSTAP